MVPFASNDKRAFSMFSQMVDISSTLLNKKFDHFEIPIEACSVKRCHFRFLGDGSFENFRLFLDKFFDFVILFSLDIVEHVLAGSICTLNSSHGG